MGRVVMVDDSRRVESGRETKMGAVRRVALGASAGGTKCMELPESRMYRGAMGVRSVVVVLHRSQEEGSGSVETGGRGRRVSTRWRL